MAVVRLPRISNATDVEALAAEPGVDVQVTDDPRVAERADLLVLPGSRAAVDDLAWLAGRGLGEVVVRRHAQGRPVLGICGGYEMLAEQLDDGVESRSGLVPGLGLLPVRVLFDDDKTVRVATHDHRGTAVTGYEIHHGRCRIDGGEPFLDGVRSANTWGCCTAASRTTTSAGPSCPRWRPSPAPAGAPTSGPTATRSAASG
mgnify:CR=1 FL=1